MTASRLIKAYFSMRYIVVAFVSTVLITLVFYGDDHFDSMGWHFVAMSMIILIFVIATYFAFALTFNLVKRNPLRVSSVFCGMAVAAIVIASAKHIFYVVDLARLLAFKSYYTGQLYDLPNKETEGQLKVLDWGKSWDSKNKPKNKSYVLIFDESGEVALPLDLMKKSVKRAIASKYPNLLYGNCKLNVVRIWFDFYRLSASCCLDQEGVC
jgi:hypothetical protein